MSHTMRYISIAMLFGFANFVLLGTMSLLYGENLQIDYHLDKKIVLSIIFLIVISCIIISYFITNLFGKDFFQILSRSFVGIFFASFSLNIFGCIRCLFSIAGYHDILYKGNFFTIRYLYSKEDLLSYLTTYYTKKSIEPKILTRKEKANILGDTNTIEGVREKVNAYVHYEQTNWWPKIQELCNTAINWGLDHPYMLTSGIAVATTTLIYPLYKILINQYNIFTLASGVSTLSTEVQNQSNKSNEIAELVQSLLKVTVKMNNENKLTIGVLANFMNLQCDLVELIPNLTDEQKGNIESHINKGIQQLAEIINPQKAAEITSNIASSESNTTSQYFHGEGHILGNE